MAKYIRVIAGPFKGWEGYVREGEVLTEEGVFYRTFKNILINTIDCKEKEYEKSHEPDPGKGCRYRS
jgi:hypothetical protein